MYGHNKHCGAQFVCMLGVGSKTKKNVDHGYRCFSHLNVVFNLQSCAYRSLQGYHLDSNQTLRGYSARLSIRIWTEMFSFANSKVKGIVRWERRFHTYFSTTPCQE